MAVRLVGDQHLHTAILVKMHSQIAGFVGAVLRDRHNCFVPPVISPVVGGPADFCRQSRFPMRWDDHATDEAGTTPMRRNICAAMIVDGKRGDRCAGVVDADDFGRDRFLGTAGEQQRCGGQDSACVGPRRPGIK